MFNSGKMTSVEDVNIDIDGLSLQLYSALFQCILPPQSKIPVTKPVSAQPNRRYTGLIPKAAQIKAECCSVMLEHSDRSSALNGSLALMYVCVKCSDPQLAAGNSLPDSHLTGQLSGLKVTPYY